MIIPREMRLIIPQGSDLDYSFSFPGLSEDITHAIAQVRNSPADEDKTAEVLNDPILDMRDDDVNAYITIDNVSTPKSVSIHVPQSVVKLISSSSNMYGLGYYWDIAITLTSGRKFVVFYGRAPVIKGVSRIA